MTCCLLTMPPGVNAGVRYVVVRRQQNLCAQFLVTLHARGRSWELVEHVCGKATSRS